LTVFWKLFNILVELYFPAVLVVFWNPKLPATGEDRYLSTIYEYTIINVEGLIIILSRILLPSHTCPSSDGMNSNIFVMSVDAASGIPN